MARFGYSDEEWESAIESGYRVLRGVAARQDVMDYTAFCDSVEADCGVKFIPGEYALAELLCDVSRLSFGEKGVAITVLVVYRSGQHRGDPGPGFYKLAVALGLLTKNPSQIQRDGLLAAHIAAAYEAWKVERLRPGQRLRLAPDG